MFGSSTSLKEKLKGARLLWSMLKPTISNLMFLLDCGLLTISSGIENLWLLASVRVNLASLASIMSKVKLSKSGLALFAPNLIVEFQSKPILGVKLVAWTPAS